MSISWPDDPYTAVETPAFVFDESVVTSSSDRVLARCAELGVTCVFALKSLSLSAMVESIAKRVSGLAASSPFEARFARECIGSKGRVHFTSPAIRPDDIAELSSLIDYISFNSIEQYRRFSRKFGSGTSLGLRVNPEMSFVEDIRYDPCRPNSKLGVPLSRVAADGILDGILDEIRGLHFHTNCESTTLEPMLSTVRHMIGSLGDSLADLDWINLGGGYQYDEIGDYEPMRKAVELLKEFGLDVFIEPGEAIVGAAGSIVASVVDMFESGSKTVAVVDTSVNHMPQVYEYQYRPEISGSTAEGTYQYFLAGATCLAGDVFGEFAFDEPLRIGSKVSFEFMGAYTMVKAHMFNGVNLPNVYAVDPEGQLSLKKRFTYEDFRSRL